MKKLHFVYIVAFILCTEIDAQINIVGTYRLNGSNESIWFFDDSTYKYQSILYNGSRNSKGNWKYYDDDSSIVLNSFIKENEHPISVIERSIIGTDSLTFRFGYVYSLNKGNATWMELVINDSFNITIEDTLMRLPRFNFVLRTFRLKISYFKNYSESNKILRKDVKYIYTRNYYSMSSVSNEFEINVAKFISTDFYDLYFKDEKFIYKENHVFWVRKGVCLYK